MDSHFGFDDEYFGIAMGQLVAILLQKINQEAAIAQVIKYYYIDTIIKSNRMRQMLTESLIHFTDCTSLYDLAFTVKSWAYKIFGVSATRVILVENGEFLVYASEKE